MARPMRNKLVVRRGGATSELEAQSGGEDGSALRFGLWSLAVRQCAPAWLMELKGWPTVLQGCLLGRWGAQKWEEAALLWT